MAKVIKQGIFPSQATSDAEKSSEQYGLQIGSAIEAEWFKKDGSDTRYFANRDNFHRLRLYARGEQSVEKYKNELSINGDLSYLNLDWKPVPIIPKFVDIVVNGIAERTYDLKAYSVDSTASAERTAYVKGYLEDMRLFDFKKNVEATVGLDTFKNDQNSLPESDEELELHMQLNYKQSIEIAQEQALTNVFDLNKYELLKKRLDYDTTVLGIACVKNSFNTAEGIKLEYVDPSDLVYSYTESPYFEDLYYVGEVRKLTIGELKKQFPELTNEDLKKLESYGSGSTKLRNKFSTSGSIDSNYVYILYFEYKTFENQVYKIKEGSSGYQKALKRNDGFNPPEESDPRFKKVKRSIECLYEGAKIVGQEKLLKWQKAVNMTRPKSDITKVQMSYNIVAPRIYKGKPESLVGRMTSFADMIQITHLKLQQVLSRLVPDGVYLDADGLAEVDLGNGTNYNPQEALNMYFQTGSVIGRSMTQDGDMNPGKIPIQELQSSGGNNKIASLIQSYNYYLQMMRDVTGLNEARDGSQPDKHALVGLQKLAAANSNTATRHILQSGLYLTLKTAEAVSLRIADVLEYSNTTNQFMQSLGKFNVGNLNEIKDLHIHDFGIFLELAPDEEEKQLLENNIQMAIQQQQINLEDAIDVREVKNLKLANQLLKIRRKRKETLDQQLQQQNIEAQGKANQEASQAAAAAEIQKQQGITESKVQMAQAQSQFDIQKLEREAAIKKELMQFEFDLNMQLKEVETNGINDKEKYKEDRKDERTKIQASQQSELIDQRKSGKAPKNFESAGFDNLGGFGLEQFDPR
tara:strand:+ start:1223 stop:3640 length:2418 start_codon:yes stop_codon:yes gene_type:complete